MHPLAQLQSIVVFAQALYRVLREPFDQALVASIWEFLSERVFHHLAGRTESMYESPEAVENPLDALLDELLDAENREAFEKMVSFLWNNDDRTYAQEILEHDPANAEPSDFDEAADA